PTGATRANRTGPKVKLSTFHGCMLLMNEMFYLLSNVLILV
ncbi:11805_t:CDS:1, partial [Rhizophagus irregularis]